MGLSPRLKIWLVVGLAIAIPLVVLTVLWTWDLRDRARARLEEEQENLAELVGDQVDAMVEDIQRLLETAARLPALRDGGRGDVEALLERIAAAAGRISGRQLVVARRDGLVVAARGQGAADGIASMANVAGFRRAVESRAFAVGDPDPQSLLGPGVVDFWQPVFDSGGAIVRLLGLGLDGRVFAGAWERLRLGSGSAVMLLSRNGRVVAQTPAAEGNFGRDVSRLPLWAEIQQRGSGGGQGVLLEDGVARVYGYRPIRLPSWYLAMGVPAELAAAGSRPALSWRGTGVLACIVVGLAVAAWWVTQDMTRPFRGIAAAARRLAAGDVRASVAQGGPVEIDAIAADLERVRQQIAEQRAALERPQAARAVPAETRGTEPAVRRQPGQGLFQAAAAVVASPTGGDRVAATERLLSELLTALGMDAGALFVVAETGRELRLEAQVGHSPGAVAAMTPLPLGEGLAGRVASSSQPVVVEDAASDPRAGRDAGRLVGFHGFAGLPLFAAGRTLGVCELLTRSRRKLAGQELKLLAAVMQPISAALASAALTQEAEGGAARLAALARLTQSITSSLNTQEVLTLSVLAAAQVLDPAYARIWVWEAAAERLRPGPWHGQADLTGEGAAGASGPGHGDGGAADLAPEARIVGVAARGRDAIFIPDLASDWRCPDPDWWAARGAASLAALPLRSGDHLLGVLTVVPRGASDFLAGERELLGALAGHAAVALQNARVYHEMAAAARGAPTSQQLEMAFFDARIGRVVAAVGRAPDLRRAAEALAAGARDALGTGAVWVAVVDASGALCLWRGSALAPLRVPVGGEGPPSLVARAVAERATQSWSGATPCWEATEGLVARRGSAAVPIMTADDAAPGVVAGGAVGALLLGDPEGGGWPPDGLARIERLGRDAGPLLDRARALEAARAARGEQDAEAQAHASYFTALKDLIRNAPAAPGLNGLVHLVLSRLRSLPACDGATLALEDSEEKVRFMREPLATDAEAVPFTVPAVETSVQLAMGLQEPVVIPDLNDSLLAVHRRWAEAGLRSLVEVPLVASGRSCGALVVASRTPGAFPPEAVALLTTLAASVAPALANAQRVAGLDGSS